MILKYSRCTTRLFFVCCANYINNKPLKFLTLLVYLLMNTPYNTLS